jgi:hypothetical protein
VRCEARANLFALDLTRVKRDLELVPAIHSVAVERVLAANAEGSSRRARTDCAGSTSICSTRKAGHAAAGRATTFYPVQPGERYPIITGANANEIRPGKQVESPQFAPRLKLLTAFDHSPMAALVDLARVDVSSPQVLQSPRCNRTKSLSVRWISTSNSIAGGSFMTRANSAAPDRVARSVGHEPCALAMARFRGGSPTTKNAASFTL